MKMVGGLVLKLAVGQFFLQFGHAGVGDLGKDEANVRKMRL
jgi:hypothetical protein